MKELSFHQKKIGKYISEYSRETEHPVSGSKESCLSLEIYRYIPINGNNKNRESCETCTRQRRALYFHTLLTLQIAFPDVCYHSIAKICFACLRYLDLFGFNFDGFPPDDWRGGSATG